MRIWLKYIGRGLLLLTFRHVAPGIVGSVDAAFGSVLDARVEHVRVRSEDVEADAAEMVPSECPASASTRCARRRSICKSRCRDRRR